MIKHFTSLKWTIDHPVKQPQYAKAEPGYELMIVPNAMGYEVALGKNGSQTNKECWDATALVYDQLHDQMVGVMRDGKAIRYVCISLDRSYGPDEDPSRIHCYVSSSYAQLGGQPDDGSWTAGGKVP